MGRAAAFFIVNVIIDMTLTIMLRKDAHGFAEKSKIVYVKKHAKKWLVLPVRVDNLLQV